MAPRQRHLTQPSQDDMSVSTSSPSLVISTSGPLRTTTTLILDDDDDNDDTETTILLDGNGDMINTKPLLLVGSHKNKDVRRTTVPVPTTIRPTSLCQNNSEIARDRHDIFNIIALVFVVAATLMNWDLRYILQGPSRAWNGKYFYVNWATTVSYFLIDLIWVALIPICVKSPDVIIKHHFVAIAYLSGPLAWPEFRWFMGACLSVEINTWFLILRRVLYKRKDHIHPIITESVSILFYLSWIAIRVFLYPIIMYIFIQMAYDKVIETGILFHWPMIFMPVHFFLCVLNLKWTYDLFLPLFMKYFSSTKDDVGVSRGL